MRFVTAIIAFFLLVNTVQYSYGQRDSMGRSSARGILPYDTVVSKHARTTRGILTLHFINGHYLFEIPPGIFHRDLLVVNRIGRSFAAGSGLPLGYAGDGIGDHVIHFSQGPNQKIFLHLVFHIVKSKDSSADGLLRSFQRNTLYPIMASFDIKAYGKDSSAVIDVTDYFNADNEIFTFASDIKGMVSAGSIQPDKSYIENIKVFPRNLEIRTVKTYSRPFAHPFITFELNSSILLLPDEPMQTRFHDVRVGYFPADNMDFDASPQGVTNKPLVTRWRLEPKKEDEASYLQGQLVVPRKPIVFYIDPSTPKKWVPYLIQGVNDWQSAFEKAGFKNAIMAREAPDKNEDSTWTLEDARYSAIVYKPSYMKNASGPHVHDPRSGEILESHINWYHNVMQLLKEWYFVQASPNDPRARVREFNDTLMGKLIRYVTTHEVGHALGLRHNFGASSTFPGKKMREKKWVEQHGFCASIMDYARFNYIAQPEDSISERGLFPRIGKYDEWAIEWGYRWFNPSSQEEERKYLWDWATGRLSKDPQLWFGSERAKDDPRCQSEDLGDDPVYAGEMGIRNLKYIMTRLHQWVKEADENYEYMTSLWRAVSTQYERYLMHAARLIGGEYATNRAVEEEKNQLAYPTKEQQQAALRFLNKELFITPRWLIDQKLFLFTGGSSNLFQIQLWQSTMLEKLTSNETFKNLLIAETTKPKEAYTVYELMAELQSMVLAELPAHKPIDLYRRNLQKIFIARLIALMDRKSDIDIRFYGNTDIVSVVRMQVKETATRINKALPYYKDPVTRAHLEDLVDRLALCLKPGV